MKDTSHRIFILLEFVDCKPNGKAVDVRHHTVVELMLKRPLNVVLICFIFGVSSVFINLLNCDLCI